MKNEPVKDESYKQTQEYIKLWNEVKKFDNLPWTETVYTDEILSKYRLLMTYPIYSRLDMPKAFIGKMLDNFTCFNPQMQYVVDLIKQHSWKPFLFTGAPGCGKTHLAIGAMVKSMADNKRKDGKYDTAESIFLRIKAHNGCENEVVDNLSSFAILVIDECEAEKITAFSDNSIKGVFQEIIRRRDLNKLQTIIIGNNPLEVKKIIGDNGYSRINGVGEIFELNGDNWKDYRPKIKKEANTADTPF
jgi:hypothetical protein